MKWDLTVHPGGRIARLPEPLRPFALVARNLLPARLHSYRYEYRSTDLATSNHSPFLEDQGFDRLYRQVAQHWYDGAVDIRWRLWILTQLARQRRDQPPGAPGNFAEFGVFRGGCAFMILSTADLPPARRYFLFDTFAGVPYDRLEETERQMAIGGEWSDTSTAAVDELLKAWRGQIQICPGDVFDSLRSVETGPLSFVHIDLNASAPTVFALEYAYERLVPGAIVVFDDYGSPRYIEQRRRIDAFFAGRPEDVLALPTGQAFVARCG